MMSDSGDSCAMSDTGESRITSEAEDSSALSDWSMVDSHGDLPDDETASTSSSVEVVDEGNDETNVEAVTPIAGSPNVITPRFILRLTSQNEDGSDTDEDKQESVTCSGPQEEVTKDTPAHVKAGQSFQQSSPEARVSREEIEELRQTIDNLKKNLLPSQAEDNSVSSIDLFGDGKSDENNVTTDYHLSPERTKENSGFHGNKIDDSLSQDSSVSSSYSFLSRDTGTACFLLGSSSCLVDGTGNKTDQDREVTPEVDEMLGTSDQTCTNNTPTKQESIGSLVYCDTIEADSELATINPGHQSGSGFWQFMSQFFEYPVKYIFLIGLVAYAGVIIVTVYSIHTQGQGDSQELGVLHQCHSERKEMQIKLDTCDKDVLDSKALIKSSAQELEALRKENSAIFEQLDNKEKEVMKLRDNVDGLVKENERLTEADQDHLQAQKDLLGEIEVLQSQVDQSTSDCTKTKQSLDKCLKEGEELKQQKIDIESNKYNSDMEFSAVQKQCQTDTDNLRSQYQFEIDNIGKQYQSDLDRIRKQYQSDLDQIKNDYQSNLDSLTMHTTAKNKYTQSQNTEDGKCDKNGNECTDFEENVGSDSSHGDESYSTNSQSGQQRQSNHRNEKHSHRTGSSSRRNANSKEDNSDEKSSKGDDYGSFLAEKVLEIMNKTREQIQDTWDKVKDMSENFWHEHQPTLYRLHDSFSRKFQHLSKRFQNKLAKKMKKWFRKGKEYTRQWSNGPQANTKRRPYQSEDDISSSNRSVEVRLVKLSHQVQALNAKKFQKLKATQKVLDIQKEVQQVNILVNEGDDEQMEKNKLTAWYLKWLSCQSQWWRNLNVVMVTDDCYLSLCCWQVKVFGGDAKQCRKVKRRHGRVEDTCTLEPLDQTRTSKENNRQSEYGPANNDKKNENKNQGPSAAPYNNDEHERKEPANSMEENWFLARGEDREYNREVPDDWFFRRQNKQNEQTREKHENSDINKDDNDDDADDNEPYYYYNDGDYDDDDDVDDDEFCGSSYDCSYDFQAGHCGCP